MYGEIFQAGGGLWTTWTAWQQSEDAKDIADKNADAVRKAGEANAEISLSDASVAENDARETEYQAAIALQNHRKTVDALISGQRARFAKSGVVASSGSALEVQAQTAAEAARDGELIRYNGQTKAQRFRSLAARYRALSEAGLRDTAAQASIIEDAGDMQSQGYKWQALSDAFDTAHDVSQWN